MPGRRRARRITAWIVGVLTALIALIAVAGLPLYVFPPAEDPGRADLIFVIGPPTPERVDAERDLREAGVADSSLYSVTIRGRYSADDLEVCREDGVSCVHAEPFTTKGEALVLSEFAPEHDVERTVILTMTPHVARTRYVFDKCFDGEVTVVAVDEHLSLADWIYQYAYQTSAFYKAWTTPCADAPQLDGLG